MDHVIYLFGLAISGFLFLLLLLKRGKETADNILMIWLGVTENLNNSVTPLRLAYIGRSHYLPANF